MELVQAFNAELSSLYEVKPPISKAKMGTITKTAIKGIKMYKHIVQSVERFIAKCRPEYKVPGLYVVDSIVRQSRHQFGPDKDVFGPRFTRNFQQTFQNLFLTCPTDDKPKIVRVLNLWQRNGVFTSEVIQPLLDMANPNSQLPPMKSSPKAQPGPEVSSDSNNEANFVMQLRQFTNSLALSKSNNGGNNNGNSFAFSSNGEASSAQIKFNKKLLDFDYGDDDDDEKGETPTESEPPTSAMLGMKSGGSDDLTANPLALNMAHNLLLNPDLLQKLQASIHATETAQQNAIDMDFGSGSMTSDYANTSMSIHDSGKNDRLFGRGSSRSRSRSPSSSNARKSRFRDRNSYKDKDERLYRYERERDRNRPDRRYRSRSKSPRNNGPERIPSESPTSQLPIPISAYEAAKEKEREKERERRKKGLPPIRKGYVTICSTTLWLGHLPKATSEVNISDALGEFGTINTIDHISARGCAYVCMNRRQDAVRAIHNLKNLKFNNANIKMAWAPGKGMKGKEFKDYWDVETGVSYIPESKLTKDVDLELLEDGGCIDEDTVPEFLKQLQQERKEKEAEKTAEAAAAAAATSSTTSVAAPTPPMMTTVPIQAIPPMVPPVPVGIPPFAIGMPPPHPSMNAMNALGGPPRLLPPNPNAAMAMAGRMNPMLAPPPPPPPTDQAEVVDEDDDDITIIDPNSNERNGSENPNTSSASVSPLKSIQQMSGGAPIPSLADFPPHAALLTGGPPPPLGLPPNMLGNAHPRGGPIPWLPGAGPHPQLLGHPPNMPMLAGGPIRIAFHPDKRNGMFRHEKPMRPPMFDMPPHMDPSIMHRLPRPPIGHMGGPSFGPPMRGPSKFFK